MGRLRKDLPDSASAKPPNKASRFLQSLTGWLHGHGGYGAVGECCQDGAGEHGRVKGCVPVYVGEGQQRFLVKLKHLNHPMFKKLLKLREELGFCDNGKLVIPCDVALFQNVLWHVESKSSAGNDLGKEDELLNFYSSCISTH